MLRRWNLVFAVPFERWLARERSFLARVIFSVLVICAATWGQLAIAENLLGAAFLIYYPSICLIAIVAGTPLAITATLMEAALALWLFIPSEQTFALQITRPVLFSIFGILISLICRSAFQSRSQIRELNLRLQHLFDANIIGVITWRIAGGIVDANDSFLRMMGYSRKDLRSGKIDWRKVTPAEWHAADTRAVEALRTKGQHEPFEKEYVKADGTRIPIVVGGTHFPGSRDYGVSFILDITEQKKTQSALQAAKEELSRRVDELKISNADLAQFAYVASHDLKEPLRVVRTHLQLVQRLLGEDISPKALNHMRLVMDASTRMYTLIDDLLEYARIGVVRESPVEIDVSEVIDGVSRSLDTAIEESQARIVKQELPRIFGISSQITQIFQNLIENAIKFRGEAPPRIEISASTTERGLVLFSVKDNGIGIAPEYAERIFEIFQTLHARERYRGTGIGLSICKKIVEQHGGRIWVESKKGDGADFRFTLPRRASDNISQ